MVLLSQLFLSVSALSAYRLQQHYHWIQMVDILERIDAESNKSNPTKANLQQQRTAHTIHVRAPAW